MALVHWLMDPVIQVLRSHLYCLTSSATLLFTTGPCIGQIPAATKPTPTPAEPMLCKCLIMSAQSASDV